MPNLLEQPFLTMPPSEYEGGLDGWEWLAERVQCQPGVVAVVPDLAPSSAGSIHLPEQAAANMKPDVGTIVSSGVVGVSPGDRVLYAPYAGVWFCPFSVDGLQVHELRFYGIVSPGLEDMVVTEPIEDCIPAKLVADRIVPVGENVLIRRDPLRLTHGSLAIELPDEAKYRTMKATVVAAGPKAFGPDGVSVLSAGQRVVYHGPSLVIGLKGVGERMGIEGDLGDYALIKARNLYCVLD